MSTSLEFAEWVEERSYEHPVLSAIVALILGAVSLGMSTWASIYLLGMSGAELPQWYIFTIAIVVGVIGWAVSAVCVIFATLTLWRHWTER